MQKKTPCRYFIYLSYNGTRYHGWQIQPNALTVQETLNNAMSTMLQEEIETVGVGRTDTGVHASFFTAHFESFKNKLDRDEKWVYKLNGILPDDIAIDKITRVSPDANARFDALSRTYKYYISNKKDPFNREFSYHLYGQLDVNKMNKVSLLLYDYADFTSFSKLHSDVKTNNCRVSLVKWEQTGNQIIFTIKADRFLRNMVRAIVGTLLEVGRGKLGINEFKKIIESKDRSQAAASAPAHGLFLTNIEYPNLDELKG
ncbi:MAG: tRNA pseudouridine(38-40) synthase TruA [Bacteroidetes bacterium]|nr:tRNA pseudouridine(38-40) synthase TruA [Bacteroidota bacterium]